MPPTLIPALRHAEDVQATKHELDPLSGMGKLTVFLELLFGSDQMVLPDLFERLGDSQALQDLVSASSSVAGDSDKGGSPVCVRVSAS